MYRVDVDWAPAYELCASLIAFASKEDHKLLDLSMNWVKRVREQVGRDLLASISALRDGACSPCGLPLDLLIWACPGTRDAGSFLRWLGGLSTGEVYELVAPYVLPDHAAMLADLPRLHEQIMHVLTGWNERYFRTVDPAVLQGLQADAGAKRDLARTMPPVELVELATSGICLDPLPDIERVILVPQYHDRPWNINSKWRGMRFWLYPADVVPAPPGEPPVGLLRLTRALSDDSRLRILHFLADGPRSFTDIVGYTGLAKSTVHHHVTALRASGLVRLHETSDGTTYSLRANALQDVGERLSAFVKGEGASR